MISREQYHNAQELALKYFKKAGIVITVTEKKRIEIVDFCLDDLAKQGVQILTYVNTAKVCAKELVLFPYQTCAEHLHPTIAGIPGKEETFRCRWGQVYLYVPGEKTSEIKARLHGKLKVTVFREIILNPGDQYTLQPDTLHWFQGGPEGAVVSEFSTCSTDEQDQFTDSRIRRFTEIK